MSGFPRPNINSSVADITEEALHSLVDPLTGFISLKKLYGGPRRPLSRQHHKPEYESVTDQQIEKNNWLCEALKKPLFDEVIFSAPVTDTGMELKGSTDVFKDLRHSGGKKKGARLENLETVINNLCIGGNISDTQARAFHSRNKPDQLEARLFKALEGLGGIPPHLRRRGAYIISAADEQTISGSRYGEVLRPYYKDSNYVETCVGVGAKTELSHHAAGAPAESWLVDTQMASLDEAERRLIQSNVVSKDSIRKICGDFWDTRIYGGHLNRIRHGNRQTIYQMWGTADNFDTFRHVAFIHENFPETILYCISHDNTVELQALDDAYNELVNQLMLIGTTSWLWENGFPTFDPRKVGTAIPKQRTTNFSLVSFVIGAKNNPISTLKKFDPIKKKSRSLTIEQYKQAGSELLVRFEPPKKDGEWEGYDTGVYVLCRADQKHKFRRLQLGS